MKNYDEMPIGVKEIKAPKKKSPKQEAPAEKAEPTTEYGQHLVRDRGEWDDRDLFWHFQTLYEQTYGYEARPNFQIDRGIAKAFVSRWGIEKATEIVEYFFNDMGGLWDGKRQSFNILTHGANWIAQSIYHDMMVELVSEEPDVEESSNDRIITGSEVLEILRS